VGLPDRQAGRVTILGLAEQPYCGWQIDSGALGRLECSGGARPSQRAAGSGVDGCDAHQQMIERRGQPSWSAAQINKDAASRSRCIPVQAALGSGWLLPTISRAARRPVAIAPSTVPVRPSELVASPAKKSVSSIGAASARTASMPFTVT
jgi:hypothetical protein